MVIYKILLPLEWAEFEAAGWFAGSSFDRRSGFTHFSSREQAGGTARRFFADEPELVVIAVDAAAMGESLRWEAATDGGTFPHVYASLSLSAVLAVYHVDGALSVEEVLPPE